MAKIAYALKPNKKTYNFRVINVEILLMASYERKKKIAPNVFRLKDTCCHAWKLHVILEIPNPYSSDVR